MTPAAKPLRTGPPPRPRSAATVLVVEADPRLRSRVAGWLHQAGFDVRRSPGPSAPDYRWPESTERRSTGADADVVVLDLWLESDTVMSGTPAAEVLIYFLSLDKPLVALTGPDDPLVPIPQRGVAVLPRPPERRALLDAVRMLLPWDRPDLRVHPQEVRGDRSVQ